MDISFETMLSELFTDLSQLKKSTEINLPEPKVDKKPTRISWLNVDEYLKKINRPVEHLLKYMKKERNVDASFIEDRIIIQGKLRKDDIEKIMLEYLDRYVKCPICNCNFTSLENVMRKDRINCSRCLSKTFI